MQRCPEQKNAIAAGKSKREEMEGSWGKLQTTIQIDVRPAFEKVPC